MMLLSVIPSKVNFDTTYNKPNIPNKIRYKASFDPQSQYATFLPIPLTSETSGSMTLLAPISVCWRPIISYGSLESGIFCNVCVGVKQPFPWFITRRVPGACASSYRALPSLLNQQASKQQPAFLWFAVENTQLASIRNFNEDFIYPLITPTAEEVCQHSRQ